MIDFPFFLQLFNVELQFLKCSFKYLCFFYFLAQLYVHFGRGFRGLFTLLFRRAFMQQSRKSDGSLCSFLSLFDTSIFHVTRTSFPSFCLYFTYEFLTEFLQLLNRFLLFPLLFLCHTFLTFLNNFFRMYLTVPYVLSSVLSETPNQTLSSLPYQSLSPIHIFTLEYFINSF